MHMIPDKLIESLKSMGFTEYEARIYTVLVLLGQADVKQIYEYWGASKPNVYQSLKSLTDKGFVMVMNSKPVMYRPVPYEIVLKQIDETHRRAMEESRSALRKIEEQKASQDMPELVWTLIGDRNIANKLEEMFSNARTSVKGILPEEHYSSLKHLSGKKVPVDLIVNNDDEGLINKFNLKNARLREARMNIDRGAMADSDIAELHRIISEEGFMVIVDGTEVIYLLPKTGNTRTGITSINRSIIKLADILFNVAWKKAK